MSAELDQVTSFDGEQVPFFIFRPRSGETRPPVVVDVHGGPEAQAQRIFDPVQQALLAIGYGVVVPNVRGSTGYGKRYASLDDTTQRLDSVARSRGGPRVRSTVARASTPTRAGAVGRLIRRLHGARRCRLPARAVGGRRRHRRRLQPRHVPREHLRTTDAPIASASTARSRAIASFSSRPPPCTHADAIRAPLFVIHGRNDPRVPVSEAEQLVDNLKRRGVPCTLCVYEDEGHGLARLDNRLDAFPRAIEFLDHVLGR